MLRYLLLIFLLGFLLQIQAQICDIKSFLDQCPLEDPISDQILQDFDILVNGNKVTDFTCSGTISSLPLNKYTNELIYLQTLRVIYYMDRPLHNHLPWTDKNLYDWIKSRVDGVDIRDGVSGGYCCENLNGKIYFVAGAQNEDNRDFDRKWIGISGNIDFFAHEVRHTEGSGYLHTSCCGLEFGCDADFNVNDLGPYGIQYWLNEAWLSGLINVGIYHSFTPEEILEAANWHLSSLDLYRGRFCQNAPKMTTFNDYANLEGKVNNYVEIPNNGMDENCDGLDAVSGLHTLPGNALIVYPNPVYDRIYFNWSQPVDFHYRLSGIDGVAWLNGENETQIDVRMLPPGFYLLQLTGSSGEWQVVEKVMVR